MGAPASNLAGIQRSMSNARRKRSESPMRKEYDFSKGVVGKYARRYAAGTNVVLLDPDVAGVFPDSKFVNDALRSLIQIVERRRSRKRA